MKATAKKTVTLKLEIPSRILPSTLLVRWSEGAGVSLSVLRGRVTADEARLELEVRGSAANVAKVVRQSAPWDAARRSDNPIPIGAPA
jgi:hypothetical protein